MFDMNSFESNITQHLSVKGIHPNQQLCITHIILNGSLECTEKVWWHMLAQPRIFVLGVYSYFHFLKEEVINRVAGD